METQYSDDWYRFVKAVLSLPTRNGNQIRGWRASKVDIRFEPTYKEWKLREGREAYIYFV